jgi:hypothetical protein
MLNDVCFDEINITYVGWKPYKVFELILFKTFK